MKNTKNINNTPHYILYIHFLAYFFDPGFNLFSQVPFETRTSQFEYKDSFKLDTSRTSLPMGEIDLLIQYLRYPSVSGSEKEAGTFLRTVCHRAGLHIRQFGEEDGNFNFAASIFPLEAGKPNLIFLNHIDVVPIGEEIDWQHLPFGGFLIKDEIWGRGAFDNKGVAVMQLAAIARFVRHYQMNDSPFNVTFLAVSCEETQCEGGASYVVEHHLDELNPYAVIGEGPPSLEGVISKDPDKPVFGIATGHKSAFWLKLELEVQTSGHGSVTPLHYSPKEMVMALERMLARKSPAMYTQENLHILRHLGRLEGGIKGFILRNPRIFRALLVPQLHKQPEIFSLFTNTITLTNISNSTTAHNTIPTKTTCFLDCRLLPQTDKNRFLQKIKKQLDNEHIIPKVTMQTPTTSCTPVDHPIYQFMVRAIQNYHGEETTVIPLILPNLNDSGWFRAKGVPVFDVVPGRISRQHLYCVHNNNERIPLSTLFEGIQVFTGFLEMVFAQDHSDELVVNESRLRRSPSGRSSLPRNH